MQHLLNGARIKPDNIVLNMIIFVSQIEASTKQRKTLIGFSKKQSKTAYVTNADFDRRVRREAWFSLVLHVDKRIF